MIWMNEAFAEGYNARVDEGSSIDLHVLCAKRDHKEQYGLMEHLPKVTIQDFIMKVPNDPCETTGEPMK